MRVIFLFKSFYLISPSTVFVINPQPVRLSFIPRWPSAPEPPYIFLYLTLNISAYTNN